MCFNTIFYYWDNILNTSGELENKFINSFQENFLDQLIDSPTRHRKKQKSNILDLVFTADKADIISVRHCSPLGKSDHEVLEIILDLPRPKHDSNTTKLNFKKMDIEGFKKYLNASNWSALDNMNCQESSNSFYSIINEGIKQFVPITKINKRKKPNQPWLNNNCHKTAKKKYLLYKRYLKSKSGYYLNKYNGKCSELKKLIRKSVRDYEKNIPDNCKLKYKCQRCLEVCRLKTKTS